MNEEMESIIKLKELFEEVYKTADKYFELRKKIVEKAKKANDMAELTDNDVKSYLYWKGQIDVLTYLLRQKF